MKCWYAIPDEEIGEYVCGVEGNNGEVCNCSERENCEIYWNHLQSRENSCLNCKYGLLDNGARQPDTMIWCTLVDKRIDLDDMPLYNCEDFVED